MTSTDHKLTAAIASIAAGRASRRQGLVPRLRGEFLLVVTTKT